MKRGAQASDHETKRLVLGVERLSLSDAKISPSPSPTLSMEALHHDHFEDSSNHSDLPRHSSSSDSDSDPEVAMSHERAVSDSKQINQAMEVEVSLRERTWSVPRIAQLLEEDRPVAPTVPPGVLLRRGRPRLRRRASDPPRIKEKGERKDGGYSAGCECDSDMEDLTCKHCRRKNSEASL